MENKVLEQIPRCKEAIRKVGGNLWFDIIIILLAFVSVVLLLFEFLADLSPQQSSLIVTIDIIIAYIFLTDFLLGIWSAKDRQAYFKSHWTDLLASIPFAQFSILRGLRLLRVFRVISVIARLKKSVRVFKNVGSHSFIYLSVIFSILILFSSALFFLFEQSANEKITTFFDAVYWAFITSSTIGYGDIVPLTTGGRIIAMSLTFFGLGIMGSIGGVIAGFIVSRRDDNRGY